MTENEKSEIKLAIYESEKQITKQMNEMGERFDKRMSKLEKELAVHNRDGVHNTEGVDDHEKRIDKVEKKLIEVDIQRWLICLIVAGQMYMYFKK